MPCLVAVGLHADVGELQDVVGAYAAEGVVAIGVGDGSDFRASETDGGSHEGLAVAVEQLSCGSAFAAVLPVDAAHGDGLAVDRGGQWQSVEQLFNSFGSLDTTDVCGDLVGFKLTGIVIYLVVT